MISIRSFSTSGPASRLTSWALFALPSAALLGLAVFVARAPLVLIAALIAGSAFGVALLRKPAAGLIAIAAVIPFSRLIALPASAPGLGAIEALLVATLASQFAARVAARRIGLELWGRLHLRTLDVLLFVFLWFAAASLTQAASWREGLPEWIKWAEFGVVYLLAARVLSGRTVRWVVAALLAAGVSQAVIGAYQFLTQTGPESFALSGRFLRAYGTFGQPNPYGGYLGYLAPVAASLTLAAAGRWWRGCTPGPAAKGHLAHAVILGSVTVVLAAGILMSWSRGAWLGLGAALVAVAGFRSRRTAVWTAAVLIALVAAIALFGAGWLPTSIEGRLADLVTYVGGIDPARTEINDANFSVLERLAHWQVGLRMFDAHPWLGVGIGNYGAAYAEYAPPHWYEPLGHAHNIFINFFAETGVLGGGAFLMLWAGIGLFAARAIRSAGLVGALATGILGSWVYLTVHNLFDNMFVQSMQLQLALLLGALAALTAHERHGHAPVSSFNRGYWQPMALLQAGDSLVSELPPFLAWLVRLPLINRLGLDRRPRELVRFTKFAMVGAFGAVVDLTVLNVMHKVFGLHLLAANTISVSVAILSNFVWNRLWTFPESRERPLATQLGQFALVNIIGLGINNVVFWALTHVMATLIHDPWNYNIAKLGAIGVVLFWNFFVNRTWTYRGIE